MAQHPGQAPVRSAYQTLILADSPAAFWPTGVTDLTGNGHGATAHGNPSQGTFLDGTGCTVFNGTTQYLEVPTSTAISTTGTGIISIEAWMRPDVLTFPSEEATGYVHWLGKGSAANGYEYVARMYGQDNTEGRVNRISGYQFNSAGGLGAGAYFQDTITAGAWIHYVLVINSVNTSAQYPTGYVSIFKNGVYRQTQSLASFSIVPSYSIEPFRIGTRDLNSFFQGAICNVALYGYELTPSQVRAHYQQIVPIPAGSAAFIGTIGSATTTTSGTQLTIPVPANMTVPAGSTVLVRLTHPYTSGGPTCADSKGNTYTRDASAASSGLNIRGSLFSGQIVTALGPGDAIRVTASATVATMTVVMGAWSGVVFGGAGANLDVAVNQTSGTSTTPGTTIPVTTVTADDLLVGFTAVQGPSTDTYTEDTVFPWISLTRAGTTGGTPDFTVNAAYDSVKATGTYYYRPVLGTSRNWAEIIAAYKAGTPSYSPPPAGTASWHQNVGTATATTAGTTLTITVPAGGIPAGQMLSVRLLCDYTATAPAIADTRGNTWVSDRSSNDTGNTITLKVWSCLIASGKDLQAGDTITITTTSLASRVASCDQFSNISSPLTRDGANGNGGTSTSPSAGSGITTAHADDLLIGVAGVHGPGTETYTEDIIGQWASLTRVSNGVITLNSAWQTVGATGSHNYQPTLGTSEIWLDDVIGYQAS
jgi:hypothetical protein